MPNKLRNQKFKRSLSLLVFVSMMSASAYASTAMHITIDPGHGGTDTGAVRGSARESEIALNISKELKQLLEQNGNFEVNLTRDKNELVSLQERVKRAEKNHAELFVSIHANSAPDENAKGFEVYFQNQLPADQESLYMAAKESMLQNSDSNDLSENDELSAQSDIKAIVQDLKHQNSIRESYRLSKNLSQQFAREKNGKKTIRNSGTTNSTGVKQAPFYVISKTNSPSVLVEVGFVSNPTEAKKLTSTAYQHEIAQKIYTGILQYRDKFKEKIDNTESKSLN